ncbi:HET-domain-containing protein [Polyplosphaeria fusca]|uniref:HET-domain-containing protein n=1 Tax=Polyplosphaeria fusca TaxID=682080 RepID=A0A9P4QQ79_9PLEO|nr:HET-domain-containing protein [Polyplosphaeria fusca]
MALYSPLTSETNEIRLLVLLPDEFDAQVRCELYHDELAPGLAFTALSYTWRDAKIRKAITVNEVSLDVTTNLHDALQHMRDSDESRTLWIDAVCINQEDEKERGAQILRMRDIFSLATGVEIWLGKEEDEFDAKAMLLVQKLSKMVSGTERALLRAVNRLFEQPWWTRVWVIQEALLAWQDRAVVRRGELCADWLDF